MRTVAPQPRLAAPRAGTLSHVVSRLALALIVSLRAVFVYGEAAAWDEPARWRDLVPARLRLPARPAARSRAAPARAGAAAAAEL